jgi:dTMP kinase
MTNLFIHQDAAWWATVRADLEAWWANPARFLPTSRQFAGVAIFERPAKPGAWNRAQLAILADQYTAREHARGDLHLSFGSRPGDSWDNAKAIGVATSVDEALRMLKITDGLFIVIDGLDGAGKSTQVPALERRLEEVAGRPAMATFEPSNGPVGELLRRLLADERTADDPRPGDTTLAHLFAADRAEHLDRIEPVLADACDVVCDRYIPSSLAYQGDLALRLNEGFRVPDLTILLTLPVEVALRRLEARGGASTWEVERLERAAEGYQRAFETLRSRGWNIVTVDADAEQDEVEQRIWSVVTDLLEQRQEGPSSASGGEDVSQDGDAANVGAGPAGDVARGAGRPFPWRAGMRTVRPEPKIVLEVVTLSDGVTYLCWSSEAEGVLDPREEPREVAPWGWWRADACEPDPADGSTLGGFLEAIRERYADPHIGISYETGIDGQNYWRVGLDYEHPCGRAELGTHPTSEMAALRAAWDSAP